MKKVYLDNLPRWKRGGNKGKINWSASINNEISFEYDGIKGNVKIIDYDKKKQIVKVKYGNRLQNMKTSHLQKNAIGNLLGLINHQYLYNKGDVVSVTTGEIEILDQITMEYNQNYNVRGYKYKCLIDGYEGEVSEPKLKDKNGCPVCSNRKIIQGINDLATTHPYILDYFVNRELAYNKSYGSTEEVLIQCPKCKFKKPYSISKLISRGFPCRKCGDGISYPEKFIFNFLEQLHDEFEVQKIFEWSDKKQYDFYIPRHNLIIEAHGLQHYENNYSFSPNVKLENIKENDKYKHELALKNNISHYVVLNSSEWENNWMRNEIEKSKLSTLYDLSKINWVECQMFACSSRVFEASELWNEFLSTDLVSKKMKISRTTVIKYLKQGNVLGWCSYDPKKNMIENGRRNGKKRKTNYSN